MPSSFPYDSWMFVNKKKWDREKSLKIELAKRKNLFPTATLHFREKKQYAKSLSFYVVKKKYGLQRLNLKLIAFFLLFFLSFFNKLPLSSWSWGALIRGGLLIEGAFINFFEFLGDV